MKIKRILAWVCGTLVGLAAALALMVYALTYHPGPVERVAVNGDTNAPVLQPGQKLRILSWNVQYMAGKNHVFFYEGGTDERPSPTEIAATLQCPQCYDIVDCARLVNHPCLVSFLTFLPESVRISTKRAKTCGGTS